MYWKIALVVILVLVVVVPAALYFGSLDWARSHTAHVNALPVLSSNDEAGEFRIIAGDFEFRARVAGMQNDGDGVILLHGFPESSIMWTPLTEALASAGYRVVAIDQRGYSPGARPTGVENYEVTELVSDVVAVADAVGFDDFHLVGHDWGSAVGWGTVFQHAERVRSWTGMAIPHIGAFVKGVVSDPDQQKRSSYFSILRKPMLAEFLMTYNGQSRLDKLLARLPEEQRNEYLGILAEPGALTAALNWYRSLDTVQIATSGSLDLEVQTPTLFIWGNQDGVVARSSVESQRPYITGPFREMELDAGHGLLLDEPEQVITAILSHIDTYANKPFDIDPDASIADTKTTIVGINHVGLSVHNLDEMLDFYTKATGFKVIGTNEALASAELDRLFGVEDVSYRTVTLGSPSMMFELTEFAGSRDLEVQTMPVYGPGMTHTCFQSPEAESGYDKFVRAGIRMLSRGDGPVDIGGYGVTYAYGYDPEGNMMELEQLDQNVIERIQEGQPWSPEEHPMWMTQVALITDDLSRLVRFYEKVLGIKSFRQVELEDRPKIDAIGDLDDASMLIAWFRLDRPNKVLELMQYRNPETPRPGRRRSPAEPGYSFSFEVGDIEKEYERLRALGVAFISEPVVVDDYKTVFANDPDGNVFSLRQPVDSESIYSIRNFPFAAGASTE